MVITPYGVHKTNGHAVVWKIVGNGPWFVVTLSPKGKRIGSRCRCGILTSAILLIRNRIPPPEPSAEARSPTCRYFSTSNTCGSQSPAELRSQTGSLEKGKVFEISPIASLQKDLIEPMSPRDVHSHPLWPELQDNPGGTSTPEQASRTRGND